MATELGAATSESQSRLFIQYLFCLDRSTGKLILKQAHSMLINPGVAVCGIENALLDDLKRGSYELYGRITIRNPDGSETIKDEKSCVFEVR